MAASLHTLFPDAAPKADAAGTHPVVAALCEATLSVLKDSLRRLFERADDLLFEMSERAAGDLERRRYFDTMRVLRLESGRVTQAFAAEFTQGFTPSLRAAANARDFDLDRLTIQPAEELEERIAVSNLAAKAEGSYKNATWEVERRLRLAAREFGMPVSPLALSPSRICDAFGVAIGALDTEFQVKLVIYKLLERNFLRDLERVYVVALDLLDRQGINTVRKSTSTVATGVPSQSTQGLDPPTAEAGTGPEPGIGPGNWVGQGKVPPAELLRQHGLDPGLLRDTPEPAAAELGRLLQWLLTAPGQPALQASTQRLSMAGRLLDEMLSEPLLPPALRPTIEHLRYPVYRSALTDAQFFADAAHPLRQVLADLMEAAIEAQAGDDGAAGRLSEVLRRASSFGSVSPAGAGNEAAGLLDTPAADSVERFLAQLREQTRVRREALLGRVRRQISQELDTHTLGRDVPEQVMRLLRGGVGPLLAMRLLRHGRASTAFQDAHDLLQRILQSLEFIPPPTPFELQARSELVTAIESAFGALGMASEKIQSLVAGLLEVYALLDGTGNSVSLAELTPNEEGHAPTGYAPAQINSDPLMPPAKVLELLGRVLTLDSWYRVFDADQNQTRWLKLASFYPHQDSVLFSGFDETNKLRLRALRFAADLAQGFSEPINPVAEAREALDALRQAKARGAF